MRDPCPTGYRCPECGERFTAGPGGAWWWVHEGCGGIVEPMTKAEAEAEQLAMMDVKPWQVAGDRYRCERCQWEGPATSEEMILHVRGSLHRRRSVEPMTKAEAEEQPELFA